MAREAFRLRIKASIVTKIPGTAAEVCDETDDSAT